MDVYEKLDISNPVSPDNLTKNFDTMYTYKKRD